MTKLEREKKWIEIKPVGERECMWGILLFKDWIYLWKKNLKKLEFWFLIQIPLIHNLFHPKLKSLFYFVVCNNLPTASPHMFAIISESEQEICAINFKELNSWLRKFCSICGLDMICIPVTRFMKSSWPLSHGRKKIFFLCTY